MTKVEPLAPDEAEAALADQQTSAGTSVADEADLSQGGAVVTMEIDDDGAAAEGGRDASSCGRACSSRATSSSTCSPGSPGAPVMDPDGVRRSRRRRPSNSVQLDQILTNASRPTPAATSRSSSTSSGPR